MNQPRDGRHQQPQPGQQPYPGQPNPGQQYPGQQQFAGQQQHPGRPPHPGRHQPHPGQPQPHPGQLQPGQAPHPGRPAHPGRQHRPNKALPVIAATLYLLLGAFALATSIMIMSGPGKVPHSIAVGFLGLPFSTSFLGSFDAAMRVSIGLASLVLVLAVALACRVPGVRWVLVVMSLVAATHYGSVVADVLSFLPAHLAVVPGIAALLWPAAGVIAALPAMGRAMRGAKPKPPATHVHGPPPVQGQWG